MLVGAVVFKDRGTGEAEHLGFWEELFDGLVVIAELGAVAFIEDDSHALVSQGFELFFVFSFVGRVEGEAEFLDGCDDDFVGFVFREEPADEGRGVCVFFDTAFLEFIEFFASLAVEVFAVDDEEALVNVVVVFEEGGSFEAGKGFSASGGVPDVSVAIVLVDAFEDLFDGIDLVRPHHQELLFALNKHHVLADHLAELAFCEELFGEVF